MGIDPVFKALLIAHKLPIPEPEFRFHPVRMWRFDMAFVPQKVAIEVQGGLFTNGRHSRGAALLKEHEKLNTAATLGWRILYRTPQNLTTMTTVDLLKQALQ